MDRKTPGQILCALQEIDDPGSKGFSVDYQGQTQEIFLVRVGDQVWAYLNHCPHTGSPLDWMPDQFLSLNKDLIQCGTHAAMFRIGDGHCIAGPCSGDGLTSIPVRLENGQVILDE